MVVQKKKIVRTYYMQGSFEFGCVRKGHLVWETEVRRSKDKLQRQLMNYNFENLNKLLKRVRQVSYVVRGEKLWEGLLSIKTFGQNVT